MRVKNIDTVTATYQGQQLTASQIYTLEANEINAWALDDAILDAISDSKLQVGNDTEFITGTANQIAELLGKKVEITNVTRSSGINDPDGQRARLVGIVSGSATANTVTDFDYKMTQLQYLGSDVASIFNGVQYYAKNADNLDEITFQIVDVDNILGYGAGFVAEEFGDAVFVMPDTRTEIILYKSSIVPNLYIRVKYNNKHATNDVAFSMNLYRHLVE